MRRTLVLGGLLAFIVGFAFLTFASIVEYGLSFGAVISILILVLLAVGIIGALRTPPR